MAMSGEETSAMEPEQGPDLFEVGLRQLCAGQRLAREEFEYSFAMARRQGFELRLYFEQKHQPVRLALVAVLTHQADHVEVVRLQR